MIQSIMRDGGRSWRDPIGADQQSLQQLSPALLAHLRDFSVVVA